MGKIALLRKVCVIAGVAALVWHFIPLRSQAQSVLPPFGGAIITVVPCNTGLWITIGPPTPGSFMIMPGTILYLYDAFHPIAETLGLYDPVTVPCVVGVVPVGGGFHVVMVGTSL
jgi:hypothetical protein